VAPSNESRLSCGALKKNDSFPQSTRAASFKRLLDGRRNELKDSYTFAPQQSQEQARRIDAPFACRSRPCPSLLREKRKDQIR